MPDRYVFADNAGNVFVHVNDGVILNIAVFTDSYRRYIRPNGCRKPHRRMFGQFGITGYMGVPRYKRRFCNRRHMLLVRIFHKNSLV